MARLAWVAALLPALAAAASSRMARGAWVAALLPASAIATSSSVATVELAGEIESVMGQPWAVIDSMSEFFETEHLGAMVDDWAKAGSLMFALLRSYWYDPAIYMMYSGFRDGTWNYTKACGAADEPCEAGYKGANPACRAYFEVARSDGSANCSGWRTATKGCESASSEALGLLDCVLEDEAYKFAVYDPRMRPWYLAAADALAATGDVYSWSDVYSFTSTGDLGITATRVYSLGDDAEAEGTSSVDFVLAGLGDLLEEATDEASVAFLTERDGALLAVSEGNITDGDGNRLNAVDSTTPLIAAAAAHAASFGPADAVVTVDDGGVEAKYWYHTALVEDNKGLAWNLTELVRIDCGTDYYLDEANLLCRKCAYPARTVDDAAGGVYTCTACFPTFYAATDASGDAYCEACPEGGVCEGGADPPYNQAGYWGDPEFPTSYYPAEGSDTNFECFAGYRGRMCHTLDSPHYYMIGDLGPFACPDVGGSGIVLSIWVFLNKYLLEVFPSLDLMTYFMQLLAIICRFNYDYAPKGTDYYTLLLDVALFDIDILKPSCVMEWSFTRSVVAQFGVVIVGVLVNFLPIAWDAREEALGGARLPVAQTTMAFNAFESMPASSDRVIFFAQISQGNEKKSDPVTLGRSMRCDTYAGYDEPFMREQPDESCKGGFAKGVMGFGILTLVVFVMGVPHMTFLNIEYESRAHGGVHNAHVQDLLGWNFGAFRAPHHSWRIRRLYLSVIICAAATIFDDPAVQIAIALVAVLESYASHLKCQPYINPNLNALETVGLRLVAPTLLMGIMRAANRSSRFQNAWFVVVIAGQCYHIARCVQQATKESGRRGAVLRAKHRLKKAVLGEYDTPEARQKRASKKGPAMQRLKEGVVRRAKRLSTMVVEMVSEEPLTPVDAAEPAMEAAVDAAMEISNSFSPLAWNAWVTAKRYDAAGVKRMTAVAEQCKYILSDVSCTSVYSADDRSMYWNNISRHFPGIIDFVTTLEPSERTIFFGIMCRLQRYVASAKHEDIRKRRYYDVVNIEDRPSMLYYLCACSGDQFAEVSRLLGDVVEELEKAPPAVSMQLFHLPASLQSDAAKNLFVPREEGDGFHAKVYRSFSMSSIESATDALVGRMESVLETEGAGDDHNLGASEARAGDAAEDSFIDDGDVVPRSDSDASLLAPAPSAFSAALSIFSCGMAPGASPGGAPSTYTF
ncbi:hypothetical protein JL721_356 [Aureococcus anophagefferens]|nr:hypothetical protein JL721_356 [Aureococcus anophagefferens]